MPSELLKQGDRLLAFEEADGRWLLIGPKMTERWSTGGEMRAEMRETLRDGRRVMLLKFSSDVLDDLQPDHESGPAALERPGP